MRCEKCGINGVHSFSDCNVTIIANLNAEVERLKGYDSAYEAAKAALAWTKAEGERQIKGLELQVGALREALHRDKTGLADALAKVIVEAKARRWVVEGRGCYEFDDDKYRKETGFALDAIEKIAYDALGASGELAHEALVAENRKGTCKDCGKALQHPDAKLCLECKRKRWP